MFLSYQQFDQFFCEIIYFEGYIWIFCAKVQQRKSDIKTSFSIRDAMVLQPCVQHKNVDVLTKQQYRHSIRVKATQVVFPPNIFSLHWHSFFCGRGAFFHFSSEFILGDSIFWKFIHQRYHIF